MTAQYGDDLILGALSRLHNHDPRKRTLAPDLRCMRLALLRCLL